VQLTFVFLPFWCPINMKVCPSILARPQTIAGSSRPARSPCSSTNLSEMLRATSRNVGLFGCRATCKRCTGVRREYVSFRNCTKVDSIVCKVAAPILIFQPGTNVHECKVGQVRLPTCLARSSSSLIDSETSTPFSSATLRTCSTFLRSALVFHFAV